MVFADITKDYILRQETEKIDLYTSASLTSGA
jgi:hypothetical protein